MQVVLKGLDGSDNYGKLSIFGDVQPNKQSRLFEPFAAAANNLQNPGDEATVMIDFSEALNSDLGKLRNL